MNEKKKGAKGDLNWTLKLDLERQLAVFTVTDPHGTLSVHEFNVDAASQLYLGLMKCVKSLRHLTDNGSKHGTPTKAN